MAISSAMSFLMKSTDGEAYTKLVDIKEFPDLGDAPETLDTTTLSDTRETSIMGLQKGGILEFPANYDDETYDEIAALKGQTLYLSLWLGGTEADGVVTPTGSNGKFSFQGEVAVRLNGAGTNSVVGMTVSVAPATPITKEARG